jgi:hypothetical protein
MLTNDRRRDLRDMNDCGDFLGQELELLSEEKSNEAIDAE